LGGNNKTVIRGGAGIITKPSNWESFLALNNNLGLATIPTGGIGVTPGTGNIATGLVVFPATKLDWNGTGAARFPHRHIDSARSCTSWHHKKYQDAVRVYLAVRRSHAFITKVTLEAYYVGNTVQARGIHDIQSEQPAARHLGRRTIRKALNRTFPFLSFIYQMGNISNELQRLQVTLTEGIITD